MPCGSFLEQAVKVDEAACDGRFGGRDYKGGLLVESGEVVL